MKIDLKLVKGKNFLSVGNNGITLDFRKGLFRVMGENLDTGSKNGIGKSGIFCDLLVFSLFGKPLRKINLPDVINAINGKNCETEVHFTINNNDYIIKRGIKPNYLTIITNGETEIEDAATKLTQKRIDEILGVDFNTFVHILVMSDTYSTPFMDMEPAKKRAILEDILGVSVFGKMTDITKKEQSDIKNEYILVKKEYDLVSVNYDNLKNNIKKLLEKSKVFEEEKQNKILSIQKEIEDIDAKIEEFSKNIKEITDLKSKIDELKKHLTTTNDKKKEKQNIIYSNGVMVKNNNTVLKELKDKPSCPLCGTDSSSDHIQKHINNLQDTINTLTTQNEVLKKEIVAFDKKIELIEEKITKFQDEIRLTEKSNDKIKTLEEKKEDTNKKLEETKALVDNFKEMINKEEMLKLKKELDELVVKIEKVDVDKKYLDYIRKLISDDGIKSFIIKKLLSFWNSKVNHYLNELNADFSICFDDTLDAIIKSRNRDELSYHSFSGGEKCRIDTAILLSVLDLSKLQNSVDMNVMIVDELLDSGLDQSGRIDVLNLLKEKSLREGKGIYVISHSDSLPDVFTKEITMYKKGGFTYFDETK